MSGPFSCIALLVSLTLNGALPCGEEGLPVGGNRGAAKQEDVEELRDYIIHPLVQPYQDAHYPALGRLFGRRAWERELSDSPRVLWPLDGVDAEEETRRLFPMLEEHPGPFEPEGLLELLHGDSPNAWKGKGTWIEVFGRKRIRALNVRSVLDFIASRLEQLRLETAPRYDFRFVLYVPRDGEPDDAGTTLTLGEAETLLQEVTAGRLGRRIHTSRAESRLGDTLSFGPLSREAIQYELDVEVAQESAIADPVVQKLLLGQQLNVTPILCPNGRDLALFGLFTSRRNLEEVKAIDLGTRHLNSLEVGRLDQRQSAFSVRLPGEGGLLLRPGGSGRPGLRLLLVVRRLDPWPQPSEGRAVIPHGVLTSPSLLCQEEGMAGIQYDAESVDEIVETMKTVLRKHGDDFRCQQNESFLFVDGNPEAVKSARQLVQFLARGHRRSFRIEIIREMQPCDSAQDTWQPLGAPIEILCLGGRIGFAQAGREQLFVSDHDVEVASKARIADPIVASCFDGVQVVAGVDAQATGVRVRLAILDRSVHGFRTLPIGSPDVGPGQAPEMREVVIRRTIQCNPGETRSLGDGAVRPVKGRGLHRTRLAIRLTEL